MHTFCKNCLGELVEAAAEEDEGATTEIKCPTCREPTTLSAAPDSDPLGGLAVNYIAKQLTVLSTFHPLAIESRRRRCSEATKSSAPSASKLSRS